MNLIHKAFLYVNIYMNALKTIPKRTFFLYLWEDFTVNTQMNNRPATSNTETGELDFESLLCDVGKNKDRDAFIKIFEYYAPRVKSFLIQGGMNDEHADELAQETMLTVWNKAERYDPDRAKAGTWIFTIARNKKIDAFRKKSGRYNIALDDIALPDKKPGADEHVISRQTQNNVQDALKSLPEEQKTLVYKSFFEGKSHGEIAKETGLPLGTVKSRIRLALQRLRGEDSIKRLG